MKTERQRSYISRLLRSSFAIDAHEKALSSLAAQGTPENHAYVLAAVIGIAELVYPATARAVTTTVSADSQDFSASYKLPGGMLFDIAMLTVQLVNYRNFPLLIAERAGANIVTNAGIDGLGYIGPKVKTLFKKS